MKPRQTSRWIALACVLSFTASHAGAIEALLTGGSVEDCLVARFRYDRSVQSLELVDADGEATETARAELVRWGEPSDARPGVWVVLRDGSIVAAQQTWSDDGAVRLDEEKVSVRRAGAWVDTPRGLVRTIGFIRGENNLDAEPSESDQLYLRNGDLLSGRVISIDARVIEMEAFGQPIETPVERVASIRFAEEGVGLAKPGCWVGLKDGTLLLAERVEVEAGRLRCAGQGGLELSAPAEQLCCLQPVGGEVVYLSDLEPVDYRHTPYFDMEWPYARDRDLRGGPLRCDGKQRIKGLAMHSAARLVYRHDQGAAQLQAEVGVADPREGLSAVGSVVLSVYLVRDGEFELGFESDTLRSGDPPTRVEVDLADATALVLVVDYADQGDSGDHAVWLDARLVLPQP